MRAHQQGKDEMAATLILNPAKNAFETVTIIRRGKAGDFEGWTRVRRADGSAVWVPDHTLAR
jgi:hypothetical protein